jgi:large subunit ribosomal protein L9
MKVLLLQDVEKLGKAGDIKDVSGGFGRNYLLPKGFATLATAGVIKQAAERRAVIEKREVAARRDNEALAAKINGQTLRFVENVGEGDRLFGSVTATNIADKLSEQIGVPVDRRKVDLGESIKRAGAYAVKVKIATGIEPVVNVIVEGEAGTVELPELPNEETTATAE